MLLTFLQTGKVEIAQGLLSVIVSGVNLHAYLYGTHKTDKMDSPPSQD